MAQVLQRMQKIGGSLMIRIPKEVVALEHLEEGEIIQAEINKVRKDWFGAAPGLKPFNKEEDRGHSKYE